MLRGTRECDVLRLRRSDVPSWKSAREPDRGWMRATPPCAILNLEIKKRLHVCVFTGFQTECLQAGRSGSTRPPRVQGICVEVNARPGTSGNKSQGTVIVIKPSHYRVKCTSDTQANNKKINEDTRPYIDQHKIDK